MRVSALIAALATHLIATTAIAECPYALLEAPVEPEIRIDESGTKVFRWRGQSFMVGPISLWDLDVQVMLEQKAFVATYSVRNESRWARQKARVYFYFDDPTVDDAASDGFVSAGLLGDTEDAGAMRGLASRCRLYESTKFPSRSFRDFTSSHSLKPGLAEDAAVRGELRIRGTGERLSDVAQRLADSPPRLKLFIAVKEARER